ncbi:hypothetical protein EI94DRAFT_1810450 [Lactarius quietus]|nr:hypothetical protein EI94DRAFT_1810450 [Lactarius quietus]
MLNIEPGIPYRIMNREAGLSIQPSQDGSNVIVGEYVNPIDGQTWFVEDIEDGLLIKSKTSDFGGYIGFEFHPEEGKKLIVGERDIAQVWEIDPLEPDYKIRLKATPFVIEFSKGDLKPGTHAKLALDNSEDAETNQVWVINERESPSHELSRLNTLTDSLEKSTNWIAVMFE